jgi:hypothetical protein
MTDTEKIIDSPAPRVEVPVGDIIDGKSAEEQTEDAARKAFDATHKPVVDDASPSAADGSTSSTAGT